jgi:hypothetical protein
MSDSSGGKWRNREDKENSLARLSEGVDVHSMSSLLK